MEAKSGYGLSVHDELRILEVYRDLAAVVPQTLVPTLLGAHTVPLEFAGRADDYVRLVAGVMVPEVPGCNTNCGSPGATVYAQP